MCTRSRVWKNPRRLLGSQNHTKSPKRSGSSWTADQLHSVLIFFVFLFPVAKKNATIPNKPCKCSAAKGGMRQLTHGANFHEVFFTLHASCNDLIELQVEALLPLFYARVLIRLSSCAEVGSDRHADPSARRHSAAGKTMSMWPRTWWYVCHPIAQDIET